MSTLKYDQPLSSAFLVRLTPQLHELARRGAEVEDRGLADFVRDAVIYRLGTLGLVPHVTDDDEQEQP
jgi:predicted HicB family RNase H-like nuclease